MHGGPLGSALRPRGPAVQARRLSGHLWRRYSMRWFRCLRPSRCAIDPAGAGVHEDVRREWSALLAHAATAADDQEQESPPPAIQSLSQSFIL